MKRILKVKLTKSDKINIEYQKYNNTAQTWDEYSLTCSDRAKPEFYLAMITMAIHVVDMCELPADYKDRIKVTGVTFSYGGEEEAMGAVIVSQMILNNSNCNLNLNTPHKASGSYNDNPADPKQLLSEQCIEDLYKLCKETELYINGDRAQMNLFSVV